MRKVIDSLSKDTSREAALIRRYGSLENYRQEAKKWGRKGGKKAKPIGGFNDPEVASRAGKLGVEAMRAKLKAELRREIEEEV